MDKLTSIPALGRWLRGWFLLLALGLTALAWAAPDYVTNWPKQVPVEKPDPVLGDKPFVEIWVYSKEFTKRFKGFPAEKADSDFSTGAHAIVFRAYKEVIFRDYPEQYRCEYDFYFDRSIQIPLSERLRKPTHKYPPGVTESYMRLNPLDEQDRQALHAAKQSPFVVQQWPAMFTDGPLDGRFATFGVVYYPDLMPGLSMARLTTGFNCEAMAPKRDDTHFWISLFGNRPKEGPLDKAYMGYGGSYQPSIKGTFNPGPTPVHGGYFRVPEAFYRAVLPKVTLVKVLNRCISKKYVLTLPNNKASEEQQKQILQVCKEVEEQGVIYDFYKRRYGLYELGF